MRFPTDYDLAIRGFTTKDISAPSHAEVLAKLVAELAGQDELLVTWVSGRGDASRSAPWSQLVEAERAQIWARGGISLSDHAGKLVIGGATWRKVPRRERAAFVRAMGYRQNSVELFIDRSRLEDPSFRTRFLTTCRELARTFEVNYLAAHNPRATRLVFPTQSNLGAGVPGFHWVNVFGGPFVGLIGERKLLATPGAQCERLGEGILMLTCPDALLEPERAHAEAAPFRDHLGEQFFARSPPAQKPSPAVRSIFALPRLLLSGAREFTSKEYDAAVTPSFDYRAILLDD